MLKLDSPYNRHGISIEKRSENTAKDMPKTHVHFWHELYFLLSGERRYFVGHKIYDVMPGELVIIPKNELHRTTTPGSKGYERYVIYFQDSCLEGIQDIIGQGICEKFLKSGCIQFAPEHINKIRAAFGQIAAEYEKNDRLSDAIILNALQGIVLCAIRYGKQKHCENKEGADKIQEVAQYICENYASDITLCTAAEMAYMEETYFSKKFKRLTGFGFKEYLIRTRIKAAEKLLISSDATVSEISDLCGFSGSNYFGDAFKHYIGCSPSEYRAKFTPKKTV